MSGLRLGPSRPAKIPKVRARHPPNRQVLAPKPPGFPTAFASRPCGPSSSARGGRGSWRSRFVDYRNWVRRGLVASVRHSLPGPRLRRLPVRSPEAPCAIVSGEMSVFRATADPGSSAIGSWFGQLTARAAPATFEREHHAGSTHRATARASRRKPPHANRYADLP
jgi:hypothetical protein